MKLIRVFLLVGAVFLSVQSAQAQLGISYHQSGLPFAGIQYNFQEVPLMAELRLSTDIDFDNIAPEVVATYSFVNQSQHEVYGGVGLRVNTIPGLVVPIGLRVYPLENFSNLGLHTEIAPIITTEDNWEHILRGSWGFHYIFGRNSN
ncbi:hypothetical protein PZB74_11575 [Porifericola rhodea]|uniref:hypothetical protein n=1 Tax=Porifericola rhodea TaxID=930972 RepID=UPI0026657216|nr:hypothetical protein [Porifericola rhodea]WKN29604.1 hypothetical protein PZB74_11575 [Porifericola rhodea]